MSTIFGAAARKNALKQPIVNGTRKTAVARKKTGGGKDARNSNVTEYAYIPVNQLKLQAPAPTRASAPSAPAPAKSTPLMPTISQASKDYRAETQRLLDETTKARDEFRADEAARVKAQAIAASNQLRSNQTANLQIQPASQTPKTGGTKTFKKRKLNQFMSGISGMVNI